MVGQIQPKLEVVHVVVSTVSVFSSDEANNNIDAIQTPNMLWKNKLIKDFYWLEFNFKIKKNLL